MYIKPNPNPHTLMTNYHTTMKILKALLLALFASSASAVVSINGNGNGNIAMAAARLILQGSGGAIRMSIW
jgi:hypothetical protein